MEWNTQGGLEEGKFSEYLQGLQKTTETGTEEISVFT